MPRDATHGQYEGEAYIGRGALLLLALAVATAPRRVLLALRQYWVLAATLVALAVYAASNRVYAGGTLVVSFDLPGFALDLGNYFRATGRFIWPLAYCLTLLPLAGLFRWWPRLPAVLVVAVAVWLQLSEAWPGIAYRRMQTTQAHRDLIDEPRLRAWLAGHDRLWQFPSWDCGGLVGANRRWPSDDSNRELQVQLAAARAGVPTNSVYMSRALKDCQTEAVWESTPATRGWRAVPAWTLHRARFGDTGAAREVERVRDARLGHRVLVEVVTSVTARRGGARAPGRRSRRSGLTARARPSSLVASR